MVVNERVVDVAPATLLNVTPSVLTCHCTVGVGFPLAAAVKVAVEPAAALVLTGLVVTVGAKFTVSVAAVVVAEFTLLVNTARYWLPFCAAVTAGTDNVADVAPVTLLNVVPPLVLICHCTVGVGFPLAVAVKVAVAPAFTVVLAGLAVITGGEFTVSVAAVVVAELTLFVNTARKRLPFCGAAAAKDNVVEVAPVIFVNVTPSVLCCHCTVGVGFPLAAAVNAAVAPADTLTLAGFVVIVGAKFTVTVAAVVVTEPTLLVNTARY